jgi:hypothetical protein
MAFKQKAAIWRQMHTDVVEGPFHWALNNKVSFILSLGEHLSRSLYKDSAHLVQPNFLSTILAEWPNEFSDEDADLLLWGSASLFGGKIHLCYEDCSSFHHRRSRYGTYLLMLRLFFFLNSTDRGDIVHILPGHGAVSRNPSGSSSRARSGFD